MLKYFIYAQWYLELKAAGVKKTPEKDSVLYVVTDFLIKTIKDCKNQKKTHLIAA